MKYFSSVALIIALTGLITWFVNLPQNAGDDVPQGKLNSISYAPFREDQGPLEAIFPGVEQIDEDLHLLSDKTHSIRTYASAEGTMPEIPALVRKHGLTLIQGAWLGALPKGNDQEIQGLIASANANVDVVKRVIVGNEVLLREDLKPEQLIAYIRKVKQAIKQPVSYADVWSMYMKYPELIKEVDYITIHILPYWEDEPITETQAPAHIERIYKKVREEADRIAPGKPILIGEAGWPSAGRQRGFAVPSVVNEAKFIRGLIKVANANGFDYNIVEAFNQPWKSKLEGVVGANWGLFSTDRREVFPLTGKVYENPAWAKSWGLSALLFLIAAVALRKTMQALPILPTLGLLVLMQLLLVLWVQQAGFLWYTSYDFWQRLFTIAAVALSAIMGGLMVWQGVEFFAAETAKPVIEDWGYRLYRVFAAYALYETLSLAVNGRYISFPNLVTAVPVLAVAGLALLACLSRRPWRQALAGVNGEAAPASRWKSANRGFAQALLGSGAALLIGETAWFVISRDMVADYPDFGQRLAISAQFTVCNLQLGLWLISLAILSLPFLASRKPSATLS